MGLTERLIAHPFVVLRVGGLPYEAGRLASGETLARLKVQRRIAGEIESRTGPVCDSLAAWLPILYEKDSSLGRAVLQIKRDLFNGRIPAASKLSAVASELPGDLIACIESLSALFVEASACATEVEAAHGLEIAAAQDQTLARFGDEALRRAIEITNPAVHDQLTALAAGKSGISRKNRNLLTASLARYVLRAARKTSPLSSFAIVALGEWDDSPWPPPSGQAVAALPESFDRIRRPRVAVLEHVFYTLLSQLEALDGDSKIILNSSLRQDGEAFAWLSVVQDDPPESRTRGTRTSRVQSGAEAVKVLARFFASAEEGAMTLAQLRGALATLLGSGSERRSEDLIATAWRNGLLLPLLPAVGDPVTWSRAAAQCLAWPRREPVAAALEDFIDIAAGDEDGACRIREVERSFGALLAAAAISEPVERFRPLLFEDCTAPPSAFSLPSGMLDSFEPEMTALLEAIPVLTSSAPLARLRRRILTFFCERYGEEGVCEDVYGFAEAFAGYMDDVGKGRASAGDTAQSIFAAEAAGERGGAGEGLLDLIAERARSGAVMLSPDEVRSFAARPDGEKGGRSVSNMFFAQLVRGEAETLLVLNHVYPGAGSMISRFLPDDEAVTAAVRDYLGRISEAGLYAELPALFGFNANLHPRLADRALFIPPFPATAGPEPLALDRLRLRHCGSRGELVFEDLEGRPISIFYLGLLTPVLMPHMHQMIHALSFTANRLEDLWQDIAARLGPDPDGAVAIPRIRIGKLVVVRRMLGVRKPDLPSHELDEPAFFARFSEWADRRALPRQLFFNRLTVPGLPAREAEAAEPTSRSTRLPKPMALDRDCPLAVRILQRSLAASDRDILFVEALPEGEDTGVTRAGKAVAAEIGFELTLKGRR